MIVLRNLAISFSVLSQATHVVGVGSKSARWDPLHGYIPIHPEAMDMANIALDLKALHNQVSRKTDKGIEDAMKIYKQGGYSHSYASITLNQPLEADVNKGTVIVGMGTGLMEVRGHTEKHYNKGDTDIEIFYDQDGARCHVGGLPPDVRETEGCFDSKGVFKIGDFEKEYHYEYFVLDDNKNERTIHSLSHDAGLHMRPHEDVNQPYFDEFQKFVDFFGEPDFADKMITASGDYKVYDFNEGHFDFGGSDGLARSHFIRYSAAYLNIGMSIISQLEKAVENCDDHCKESKCRHDSLHGIDGAVAFYTGSLQAEDGSGNLLYGLANEMCQHFKTCGRNGNDFTGTAKVNLDIFDGFVRLQEQLKHSHCIDADVTKDAIIQRLFVPLIQAFQYYVHRRHIVEQNGNTYRVEDAAPFSAAILPLLGHCKMPQAKDIQISFAPGDSKTAEDLDTIVKHLHEHMECMGLCCHQVGGFWDTKAGMYYEGMEPCDETRFVCMESAPEQAEVKEEKKSRGWIVFLFLLIAAAAAGGYYFYRKKQQNEAVQEKSYQTDENDSSDDDKGEVI